MMMMSFCSGEMDLKNDSAWDQLLTGLGAMEEKETQKFAQVDARVAEMFQGLTVNNGKNSDDDQWLRKLITAHINQSEIRMTTNHKKRVVSSSELNEPALFAYQHICKECPDDESILEIQQLISRGPIPDCKISGRMMDTVMTAFSKFRDTTYYLDETDPSNTFIVDYVEKPGRKIILFDVAVSYKSMMRRFSKAYFDCFGRGDETVHTLQNGSLLLIILCQFTYFIWAKRYCVFIFIQQQLPHVITIRQHSQRSKYIPKKRKRKQVKPIETNKKNTYIKLTPSPSWNANRILDHDKKEPIVRMRSRNIYKVRRRLRKITAQKPKSILDFLALSSPPPLSSR